MSAAPGVASLVEVDGVEVGRLHGWAHERYG
jgi:hypothetical protein